MFDYSRMTSQKFEELAKNYLEIENPGYVWNITERSGDGNRDVVCRYTLSDAEIEYWAEAKFTANPNSESLKKGQLDPTLVSAFLYQKPIAKISFISNNTLPVNYFYRLEDFHIKTSIGIKVIAKEEFEQWLMHHPEICAKFQISNTESQQDASDPVFSQIEIKSALITSHDQDQPYAFEKYITTQTKYALYLLIVNYSGCPQSIRISLLPSDILVFSCNDETSDAIREISNGTSVIKLSIVPTQEFSGDVIINLEASENQGQILTGYTLKGIKCLYPQLTHIAYAQQNILLTQFTQYIRNSFPQNEIIYLSGAGATGKTHLLCLLQQEWNDFYLTHYFAFTGNNISDGELLCRIIIYLNLGDVLSMPLEILISIIQNQYEYSEQKTFMEMLLMHLQEGAGAAVRFLIGNATDSNQLVFPNRHMRKTIAILDDLHKAKNNIKTLLGKCLQDFSRCTNNQILICGSRETPSEWIETLDLDTETLYLENLHGLSKDDKLDTARYYFPDIDFLEFDARTNDLLTFSSITEDLLVLVNKSSADPLYKRAMIQKQYYKGTISNHAALKGYLKKHMQYKELIELVYSVQIGITYSYLISVFSEESVAFLLKQKIFLARGEFIYPFHDLYVDTFFKMHKRTTKTISYILDLARINPEQDFKYYALLLSLSPGYYIRCCTEARLVRNRYFEKTELYPAYVIALSIVENRPDSQQPDLEYINDLFILASSAFYEKSSEEIMKLYQKVLNYSCTFSGNPVADALALHTKTEIVNQKFWSLDVKTLGKEIDQIQIMVGKPDSQMSHDEKYAFLNCLNRRMVVELLMDRYEKAKKCFMQALEYSETLNEPAYVGFAHMDYARGLYLYDAEESLIHMETAQKIFSSLNVVERRRIECNCEVAYLRCLLYPSIENIKKLKQTALILKDSHYWELFAKAELKIAAVLLLSEPKELKEISNFIVTSDYYILSATISKRFQLISAHIKYLFYTVSNNSREAAECAKKYCKLAADIGPFYQEIGRQYHSVFFTKDIVRAIKTPFVQRQYLLLDPRIW